MSSEVISMDIGTEEHGGTTAQNVEASTLLLNQRSTLATNPISFLLCMSLFSLLVLQILDFSHGWFYMVL
jgi:hypothetical protein